VTTLLVPEELCLCSRPLAAHPSPAKRVAVCDRLPPDDWKVFTDSEHNLRWLVVPPALEAPAMALVMAGPLPFKPDRDSGGQSDVSAWMDHIQGRR
jgi:hypothetical protein